MNQNITNQEPVIFVTTLIVYYLYVQLIKYALRNFFNAQKENKHLVPYFKAIWLALLIIVPMASISIYGIGNRTDPKNIMNISIIMVGMLLVGCYDYYSCLNNNKQNQNLVVQNVAPPKTETPKVSSPAVTDVVKNGFTGKIPEYKKETSEPVPRK